MPSPANLPFESCSALRGAAFKGGDRLHRRISPLRVVPHSVEQPFKGGDRLHRRISPLRVAPHPAEQPSKGGDRLHWRISPLRVAPHPAEQPSKAEIAFYITIKVLFCFPISLQAANSLPKHAVLPYVAAALLVVPLRRVTTSPLPARFTLRGVKQASARVYLIVWP